LFITSIEASFSASKSVFIFRIVDCPTNHLSEKRSDWDFLPRENVCPGGIDFEHLTHIVCPVSKVRNVTAVAAGEGYLHSR
jgi:hypothetical protein